MIETERMYLLEGSLSNPDKRIWYAIWNMELQNAAECFLSWTAISRENIPVSRRLPMKKRGREIF